MAEKEQTMQPKWVEWVVYTAAHSETQPPTRLKTPASSKNLCLKLCNVMCVDHQKSI